MCFDNACAWWIAKDVFFTGKQLIFDVDKFIKLCHNSIENMLEWIGLWIIQEITVVGSIKQFVLGIVKK